MREFVSLFLAVLLLRILFGEEVRGQAANTGQAPPAATNELEVALKKLRVAPGLKAAIFAAEPLIQNPVSFAFDERGRLFVVETHRRRTSVFDIRNHRDWLDAEFSFRSVADRSNFFRKVLVPGNTNLPSKIIQDRNKDGQFDWRDLEVESERVRLIWDTDGDGRADQATTFAEGFNSLVSGVAAGVLARKGDVYFTCVPNLWLLRDNNNDGVADFKKSLAEGFGVHISFGGHDLHGLKFGPDGKLYFSIADRGAHVPLPKGSLSVPDTGAIFRCDPDGSNMELVATGFRNPQELAFDQYGNLWTGDNNADGGDKARWLYVLEGADYGWHIGWQHQPGLGAWNSEGLWQMPPGNSAAYLLPPVAHIGHGPAGLVFYPGTGLPVQFRNHFLMCDFPGGIYAFSHEPRGAGYAVVNLRQILWDLYPVDVDVAPGGGLYVLDWVEGWEKTGKGRVFRLFEEESLQTGASTGKLLADGFDQRSDDALGTLLGHPDQRIRMEAQFTLAGRGVQVTNLLAQIALNSPFDLARLHAIWGLGQIGRSHPQIFPLLFPILDDVSNGEARAQACKVLGEGKYRPALALLLRAATDPIPRVRLHAAMALGKLKDPEAVEILLHLLRDNNDVDPFLRHAAVFALAAIGDVDALEAASQDSSPAVRLGVLLALRKLQRPEVARFLYDTRPQIVLEAARAIYELPIEKGMSQLASLVSNPNIPKGAMRRALHANYRLGRLENAMALSELAANEKVLAEFRTDAMELLSLWGDSPNRDLFLGLWRPLPPRETRAAQLTLRGELPELLNSPIPPIRLAAVQAAVRLGIESVSPQLFSMVTNQAEKAEVRLAAFRALGAFKDPKLPEAARVAAGDSNPELRKEAASYQSRSTVDPTSALLKIIDTGTTSERQNAFSLLAELNNPAVDPILLMWLDRVITGKAPKELHMEILQAAAKRKDPLIVAQLEKYNRARAEDSMAQFSECVAGGNAEKGEKIFLERADLGCVRCHKLNGTGGEVGPDLTGVGSRLTREELLESIVLPNKRITKGYENLVIKMKDGAVHTGLLRGEDLENVLIESGEDGLLKIPKASIDDLNLGWSAMLPDLATMMSKSELRDLVEFLATQK